MSENETMNPDHPHHDDDRLRRYVLRELPERETDELELALLQDRRTSSSSPRQSRRTCSTSTQRAS